MLSTLHSRVPSLGALAKPLRSALLQHRLPRLHNPPVEVKVLWQSAERLRIEVDSFDAGGEVEGSRGLGAKESGGGFRFGREADEDGAVFEGGGEEVGEERMSRVGGDGGSLCLLRGFASCEPSDPFLQSRLRGELRGRGLRVIV